MSTFAKMVHGIIQACGSGPWDGEPDRLEFESWGYPCLILRGLQGNLCGYVAVPKGHPAYGQNYDHVDVEVHGGLTYGRPCQEEGPICHVPKPGEPDDVWWLGFDCAHAYDLVPVLHRGLHGIRPLPGGTYRDIGYVKNQCIHLARQLKALAER